MNENEIGEAPNRNGAAAAANDFDVEHDIYREDAVLGTRNRASVSGVGTTSTPPAPRSRRRWAVFIGSCAVGGSADHVPAAGRVLFRPRRGEHESDLRARSLPGRSSSVLLPC
jgi:hypothetical protein